MVASSCGGDGLGTISVSLDIDEQTIPGTAPPAVQGSCNSSVGSGTIDSLAPISLDLRDSRELEGRSIFRFTVAILEEVRLAIVPPSQPFQTWDFLDAISLFADDDPSDSDPPVLIARLDPVPRGVKQIVIPGTGTDISDIVSADTFTVTGQVRGRPPCADVHFNGEAEFDVGF
ncbi:MAG: hypothetical protein ACREQQ_02130 [Candidatus Binatia bacterium]